MKNKNDSRGTRLGAAILVCALGTASASEGTVFRCQARGRVVYQDAPCQAGTRETVVDIPEAALRPSPVAGGAPEMPGATVFAAAAPARARPREQTLREVLPKIRLGMTRQELEALDGRLRNGRRRTLEANGHRHEWRYFADNFVVQLADDVVVAVYR